jgi:hypothetical protein
MNPFLVIGIPLVLIIVGMILNSLGSKIEEPVSSVEESPAKRLEADRKTYRKVFDLHKFRYTKRQQRVGQYAWLLLFAFIASHLWMYFDTVNRATAWTQVASLRTVATEEGKQMALSITLSDGSNENYLIKLAKPGSSDTATTKGYSKEKLSSWELSDARTALSIGDKPLPLGIALTISQ